MSDVTSSDHSSDSDFQPSENFSNNSELLSIRQTRSKTKRSRRSKSLNNSRRSVDNTNILGQSIRLVGSTETILDATSNLLDECKSILDITNHPSEIQENQNIQENQENQDTQENQDIQKNQNNQKKLTNQEILEEYYRTNKTDWTADQIIYENYPSTRSLQHQDYLEIMNDTQAENSTSQISELQRTLFMNDEIKRLIDLKVTEALNNKTLGTQSKNTINSSDSKISLEEALRHIPNAFDGRDVEALEVFLDKCDFAIDYVIPEAIPGVLRGIKMRLKGRARTVTKYKKYETWEELRETLKANLEPQRTTQFLFLELYATKQKPGEDVITYAKRIEQLQNVIVEQETVNLPIEAAKALENSINRQVLQVFMEGLGELKSYIKSKNVVTLEKAIQDAREEERIRNSNKGAKLYLKDSRPSTSKYQQPITTGNCYNCGLKGHLARYCTKKNTQNIQPANSGNQASQSSNSTYQASQSQHQIAVNQVSCNYCKKPGHTIDICRKRQYKNSLRNAEHQNKSNTSKTENSQRQTQGARPAGNLQAAIIQLQEHSHVQQN